MALLRQFRGGLPLVATRAFSSTAGPRIVTPAPAALSGCLAHQPSGLVRHFSEEANNKYSYPVLGPAPLVEIPNPTFVEASDMYETSITTLDNGLVVASEDSTGMWSCINVIVGVGPRHEPLEIEGVSYFLDRLAFRSTSKYSHADMIAELQKMGGNFTCTSNRETMMYTGTVFHHHLEEAMDLLAEVVLRPLITEDEVQEQRENMEWEQSEIIDRADVFLPELLHLAAYGYQTLGMPHVCCNSTGRTAEEITAFRERHYVPSKMAISGAGVDHDVLVGLAEKYFGHLGPSAETSSGIVLPPTPTGAAEYTGGLRFFPMDRSPSNNALGVDLTQIGLGFKGTSWADDDLYAYAVLQLLLGGGLSFSVGGPGKGVFTRMYSHILNLHPWVYLAQVMNLSYEDSGFFFFQGAAPPAQAQTLMDLFLREVEMLAVGQVPQAELERAQRQLMAHLLMNLESKPIVAEDIGRQVLAFQKRLSAAELMERIEAVTAEDIKRIANIMVQSPPAVAGYGDVTKLHPYEYFEEAVASIAAKGASSATAP